ASLNFIRIPPLARIANGSGRAGAALSMYAFRGGVPADNVFIDNRLEGFEATVADIFVGSGVARSHITGPGSLWDHGRATILERYNAGPRRFRPGRAPQPSRQQSPQACV